MFLKKKTNWPEYEREELEKEGLEVWIGEIGEEGFEEELVFVFA